MLCSCRGLPSCCAAEQLGRFKSRSNFETNKILGNELSRVKALMKRSLTLESLNL